MTNVYLKYKKFTVFNIKDIIKLYIIGYIFTKQIKIMRLYRCLFFVRYYHMYNTNIVIYLDNIRNNCSLLVFMVQTQCSTARDVVCTLQHQVNVQLRKRQEMTLSEEATYQTHQTYSSFTSNVRQQQSCVLINGSVERSNKLYLSPTPPQRFEGMYMGIWIHIPMHKISLERILTCDGIFFDREKN